MTKVIVCQKCERTIGCSAIILENEIQNDCISCRYYNSFCRPKQLLYFNLADLIQVECIFCRGHNGIPQVQK